MSLIPARYRSRPWSWTRDEAYLSRLRSDGVARGIFFDTSGNARVERINPTAQYNYVWRSDEEPSR